jgi:TetR/AcrR family transcriptional repressor of mexJK operon
MSTKRRSAGRPKDESKRAAILKAAGACFLRSGFARTSMDAIAEQAGVSKLTLYSHFLNKDLLFKAMIVAKCREQGPPGGHLELAGQDPRAALIQIGTNFVRLMVSPEVLALNRVVATESVENPKLAELLYQAGPEPTLRGFVELLRAWIARGLMDIPDPERAADHYFSMLRGMLQFRLIMSIEKKPTEQVIRRHVEDCVDMFLRAYQPGRATER